MRIFGKVSELTAVELRADTFALSISPNSATTYTADRDLELPPGDADDVLVAEDSTQTLTNKSISGASNTLSAIPYSALVLTGTIVNADISASAAIDATKIADGSVSSTEFQYLGGVTSDIQTQINNAVSGAQPLDADLTALAALATTGIAARTAADTWALRTLTGTANKIVITDGDGVAGNPTLNIGTDVVTLTDTQTLSGKSIDGDDNTITDVALASLKTVLGDANKVIRRDASGVVVSDNSIPNSSALMTIDSTQVVTNKTLTANLVDSYLDFNDEASATNPAASTKRLFAKADGMYIRDESGNEIKIGAGSGAGRNYLEDWFDGTKAIGTVENSVGDTLSSSTRSSPTAWGASNTSLLTVTNTTSSPLRQASSILLDSVAAGAAFIETPLFDLDLEDEGKSVYVSFDVGAVVTSGDYDVVMMRYNSSNVLQERIPIAGSASSGTPASAKVPTGAATNFKGFFVSGSTTTDKYALRFRRLSASDTTDIKIDTLLVGPQQQLSAASVTDDVFLTLTAADFANSTGVTVSTGRNRIRMQQVGNRLYFNGTVGFSNAAAGSSTSDFEFILPNGYTIIDTPSNDTEFYGIATVQEGIQGIAEGSNVLSVLPGSTSNRVRFYADAATSYYLRGTDIRDAAGFVYQLRFDFSVPVTQLSSNTTMANRALEEFAYNTSRGDTDDSSSFGWGANGTEMPNGTFTVPRQKTVRFQTPVQVTDKLVVEIQFNNGAWFEVNHQEYDTGIMPFTYQSSTTYGIGIRRSALTGVNTDVDVSFGRYYQTGATYAAAGSAWSSLVSGWKWRVRKVSGGALVGYPIGARNVVGDTSGTAVPAGMIGEVKAATSTTAWSTSNTNVASVVLTPGVWRLNSVSYTGGNSTDRLLIANITNASGTDGDTAQGTRITGYYSTGTQTGAVALNDIIVNISTTTTYYLNVSSSSISGAAAPNHRLQAVRIA